MVVAPEACDDGNLIDGDGCNTDCEISGSLVWCKAEIGEDGGGVSGGHAVAVDGEGNAIVVGMAFSAAAQAPEAVVAKYTPAGDLAWTQTLPGAKTGQGVVVRADSTLVVSVQQPLLFHLTPSGDIAQTLPLPDTFTLDTNSLAQSPAGAIAFAANTHAPGYFEPDRRGVIGALNDDLSLAWTYIIEDQDAATDAHAITSDLNGNWFLGGDVVVETIGMGDGGGTQVPGGFVRKYDHAGTHLWTRPVLLPDEDQGVIVTAVRTNAVNEVVALGINTVYPALSAPNLVLATFSSEGEPLEQRTLPTSETSVFGRDLVLTPTEDRIVTGTIWPADKTSPAYAFTTRYNAVGALQWSFRNTLMPTRSAGFTAVNADATGDLVVTGVQVGEDAGHDRILVCRIRR